MNEVDTAGRHTGESVIVKTTLNDVDISKVIRHRVSNTGSIIDSVIGIY